mmetsp:Transcript_22538/g.48934  ORF Transcript_22538/g.48934 Transcript_22538/m.48934 type:complete len:212 (-) Transcript_22538:15-650(-)
MLEGQAPIVHTNRLGRGDLIFKLEQGYVIDGSSARGNAPIFVKISLDYLSKLSSLIAVLVAVGWRTVCSNLKVCGLYLSIYAMCSRHYKIWSNKYCATATKIEAAIDPRIRLSKPRVSTTLRCFTVYYELRRQRLIILIFFHSSQMMGIVEAIHHFFHRHELQLLRRRRGNCNLFRQGTIRIIEPQYRISASARRDDDDEDQQLKVHLRQL